MSIQSLKTCLMNKSVIVDIRDPELISRAEETAHTLINRAYRDDRTDEQIRAHSLEGTIREFAIQRLTGGEINSQTPDFVTFDRNTFAWDVLAHDLYIEVKPQRGENFNIRERTKNTLINNADYYDVIVTVDIHKFNSSEYKVTPLMLIRSDHFVKHVKKSQFQQNGLPTYFYDCTSPCIKLAKPTVYIKPDISIESDKNPDEDFILQLPKLESYGSETITTIFSRHYPSRCKEWRESGKRLVIMDVDRPVAMIEPFYKLVTYKDGRFKKTMSREGGLWFPSYILAQHKLLELYDSRFAECEAGFIQVKIPA